PGLVASIFQAADTQALTLPDGVVHQAVMASYDLAINGLDGAGLGRQVLLEKVTETTLADKTDASGVLLLCCGQAVFFGDGSYLRFFQLANGKQGLAQLLAAYGVEEVALVLVRVQALEQFAASVDIAAANIVPRCDQVGAERQGIVEECLELDFTVAEDVRVRRSACLVFGEEMLEYV